jgi:hypothetical protein
VGPAEGVAERRERPLAAAQELLIAHVRRELPITREELVEHAGRVLPRARPIVLAPAAEHLAVPQ